MVSAARAIGLRQPARNRCRMADMRVPEWAMPTQNTKLMRYVPQTTGMFWPPTPMPTKIW